MKARPTRGRCGSRMASERAGEDVHKFVTGEGDGIRFHAAGVESFLNKFWSVRGREAVTAEGRNLQMSDESSHPGKSLVGNGGFPAGEKAGDNFITAEGFAGRLAFAQRGEICGHDLWKQRGTDGAMGRRQNAADGTGQAMHGTQPGIRQGESTIQTGEGHVFAGAVVVPIVKGGAQRARGAGDAVPAKGVGDGIGARANKRFDELGEGVQPVLAVRAGGRLRVNSGSTMAMRGSMNGLRRLTLRRCSGEARTALRVTSEPVPAVVGMAMNGADGFASGRPRPMISR